MLEETGISPVPGSSLGQKEGTYHFRSELTVFIYMVLVSLLYLTIIPLEL